MKVPLSIKYTIRLWANIMANNQEFAKNVQSLAEFIANAKLSEMPMIGRKGFGFRLCDKRRRVIRVNGMTIHVSPAKLRDKYGDIVFDENGHAVRCVPAQLFNNVDGGDPYASYRDDIAAFMKEQVPFGDWQVGMVEFDPDSVKEWDMATEWTPAKVRKWCHEHPYWLVWWKPADLVDTGVDDIVSMDDIFTVEAYSDIDELL